MKIILPIKLCMFFSSYSLLFLSLTILYYQNTFLWILFLITIFSTIILMIRIRSLKSRKVNRTTKSLKNADTKNSDILSYIVTYLVPFTSAYQYQGINQYLSFIVLLFGIAILYVRSNLLHINPILSLLGYNILEVTFVDDRKKILITKNNIDDILSMDQITFCEFEHYNIVIECEEVIR